MVNVEQNSKIKANVKNVMESQKQVNITILTLNGLEMIIIHQNGVANFVVKLAIT